jgi:hypothetical protein
MKLELILTTILLMASFANGQGAFIYDQQSSTNETFVSGGAWIQQEAPYGQSFTTTFSTIDFIRLSLSDLNPNNNLGATLFLNLRTNSINGSILATTPMISLTNGFSGFVNFIFNSSVVITPGATYAFEIAVQSGSDSWAASAGEYNYPGGIVYANGVPASGSDLWFREGLITVPEPSSALLVLLGSGVMLWRSRKRPFN